jgi:hypothetical protein
MIACGANFGKSNTIRQAGETRDSDQTSGSTTTGHRKSLAGGRARAEVHVLHRKPLRSSLRPYSITVRMSAGSSAGNSSGTGIRPPESSGPADMHAERAAESLLKVMID